MYASDDGFLTKHALNSQTLISTSPCWTMYIASRGWPIFKNSTSRGVAAAMDVVAGTVITDGLKGENSSDSSLKRASGRQSNSHSAWLARCPERVDEIREVRLLEAVVPRRKRAEWRVRVYQPCCRIASFGIYLRTANISVASCRLY